MNAFRDLRLVVIVFMQFRNIVAARSENKLRKKKTKPGRRRTERRTFSIVSFCFYLVPFPLVEL